MPGLDDVLERLVNDAGFRGRLAADPAAALAGYDLTSEDLALLASQVTDGAGASGAVEARTSRASLAGFMGAFGDVAEALSPAADAMPTESISMNFEEIKATYDHEAPGDPGVLNIYTGMGGDALAPQEETYLKVELENVQAVGDPQADADLAASGDDPDVSGDFDGDGDVDGRDFLAWQRQLGQNAAGAEASLSETPPDPEAYFQVKMKEALVSGVVHGGEPSALDPSLGAEPDSTDVLAWDVGDGSDGGVKGEEIELQSWAPSTPPAQADSGPLVEEIGFVFESVVFNNDTPEPDGLATPEGGGVEPTGPIADVLYSAGGDASAAPAVDSGVAGPGRYVSQDGGATWVEGAPQIADDATSYEFPGAYGSAGSDPIDSPGSPGLVPVVGDWNGDAATADGGAAGVPPQSDELVHEGTVDPEPLAVELENVQITSYQLGVLDHDTAPDDKAVDLSPDSPG